MLNGRGDTSVTTHGNRGNRSDVYRGRDPRAVAAYTAAEAARYLRIPERTLYDWSFGYSYPVKNGRRHAPALIKGAGPDHHLLSFTNLAELHVLDALRRGHHLRMKRIRQAIVYVGRRFETDHPLIHQEMWTDGLSVFIDHYGELVNATQEGQLAMRQVLQAHLQRIERDVTGIVRLFPLTRKRRADAAGVADEPRIIAIDPQVAFGRPVIKGSRIPTVEVAERFKAGESLQDLATDFRRPIEEIEEAVRVELDLEAA
jgi:uncharacterized protein (DUF433 family)